MSKSEIIKKLTPLQAFFLEQINASRGTVNPGQLMYLWYERQGKNYGGGSQSQFGANAAAHKACRKLAELGLIKEVKIPTYYIEYAKV